MSKVILQDHNTGNEHEFDNVDDAEKAYTNINKRNQDRGFTANFTVRDQDGTVLSRNGEHPAAEKKSRKAA